VSVDEEAEVDGYEWVSRFRVNKRASILLKSKHLHRNWAQLTFFLDDADAMVLFCEAKLLWILFSKERAEKK